MNDPVTGKRAAQGKRPRGRSTAPPKSKVAAKERLAHGATVRIKRARAQPLLRPTVRNFADLFRAPPADRVKVIKHGVSAVFVLDVAKSMGISKETVLRYLRLSRATIDRKVKN